MRPITDNNILRAAKIICLGFLSVFTVIHGFLFWSRFQYQSGVNHMHDGEWDLALASFDAAESSLPVLVPAAYIAQDRFRIYTQKGIALNEKALKRLKNEGQSIWVLLLYRKSKENLELAAAINPDVYAPAYWLARTVNSLELLYSGTFPGKENPYSADPYYENAVRLWPNGITVHYSYARYLALIGDKKKLGQVVQYMTYILPEAYQYLKEEPFFDEELMAEMEKGLIKAKQKGTTPRYTLQALADIYSTKGERGRAVETFLKSMTYRRFANNSNTYIKMGTLLLRNHEASESLVWFTKAVKESKHFENTLTHIYRLHKRENQPEAFIKFAVHLEKNYVKSHAIDLNIAKAWMDMEKNALAKSRLLQVNAVKKNARVYYLLARIAEREKDWDQMELSAQKAATLGQENSEYYHLFSKALFRQKKYIQSEKAATKAIEFGTEGDAWLFDTRARSRWHQQGYAGAISDWKRAFDVASGNGYFPYWISRAYEREGMFNESLRYVKKAIALDDKNSEYKELKKQIEYRKQNK